MRYAKLSWTKFILVIYSNTTQSTYFLIELQAMTRKVIWVRSVHPSVQKFSWNWLFSFLGETQHGVRGPYGVVYDRARFFQKNVLPPKWGKQTKPRVLWTYRKVQFFSWFFIFLSVWSTMKACITVILVCLNKFHIWENYGFWDMAQNALRQSNCRIFWSIARL